MSWSPLLHSDKDTLRISLTPGVGARASGRGRGAAYARENGRRSGACAPLLEPLAPPAEGKRWARRPVAPRDPRGVEWAARSSPGSLGFHPSAQAGSALPRTARWRSILRPDSPGRQRRGPDGPGPQIQKPTRLLGREARCAITAILGQPACLTFRATRIHFPSRSKPDVMLGKLLDLIFKIIPCAS